MKSKAKLLPLLIILTMMFSFNPLLVKSDTDSVEWHSSLESGTNIKFRVQQSMVFNASKPLTFLGEQLSIGDIIEINFKQNPPTEFSDLYNDQFPSWLEFKLNSVPLSSTGLSTLEIEYTHFFIFPTAIQWTNGSTSTLSDFLNVFHPTHAVSVTGAPSITVHYQNYTIFLPINTNLGVTQTFYLDYPEKGLYEILLEEVFSPITTTIPDDGNDDEYDGPSTIEWSSSIKKDVILSWKITEYVPGTDTLTIGEEAISLGSILQMGYVKNPPTDAEKLFAPSGPPSWLDLYVNSNQIDLSSIGGEGQLLLFLTLPLIYKFDNGTEFTLGDFLNIFFKDQDDFKNVEVTDKVSNWNVYWEEHDSDGPDSYFYNMTWIKSTGIVQSLYMDFPEGEFTWTYFEDAANIGEEGETKTIDESYSIELDYPSLVPGFEFPIIIFVFLLGLVIRQRRRGKST